jgi:hypothetical protein
MKKRLYKRNVGRVVDDKGCLISAPHLEESLCREGITFGMQRVVKRILHQDSPIRRL